MAEPTKTVHFFLGASTPFGFHSFFNELQNPDLMNQTFIIKGGPGTGKSTMMKNIAKDAGSNENFLELIHCSSDPGSLDGIIFSDIKTSIVDGTSPHIMEPKYPGVFDSVISLFDCLSTEILLARREKIIRLFQLISQQQERAFLFLSAAGSLNSDTYRICSDNMNLLKIEKLAERICKREIPATTSRPLEKSRFLTAPTPLGNFCFQETVESLCDKLYVIQDEYGAASKAFMQYIRNYALKSNHQIISCYCSMSPNDKIDHLFIPALHLGFSTSNKYHRFQLNTSKNINAKRFYDMEKIREKKHRISFNKKAVNELLRETVTIMAQSKEIHDQLENEYISAMDYTKLTEKEKDLVQAIKEKYKK